MAETGVYGRFPGSLDPRAQEFRPRYSTAVFIPQSPLPQPVFIPYPSVGEIQVVPFGEGGVSYAPSSEAVSTVATRSLVVSPVPCDASETMVRRELEGFGDVRGVQMERVKEGIVIVHFYDIRHSERALRQIRDQHMQFNHHHCRRLGLIAGHPVWAHFVVPSCNAVPSGRNQGSIVIFNLDNTVSTSYLREIFEAFGPVKELRETPMKKHQRFVEFYDIRDAGKALIEMNGKEINGKPVVIEFSRPGGHGNKFFNANLTTPNELYSRSLKYTPPRLPPPPPRKFVGGAASNFPPRWSYSKPHGFSRKSNPVKVGRSPINHRKSLDSNGVNVKMASLHLEGDVCSGIEEMESCGVLRKNSNTSHTSLAVSAEQQQLQLPTSRSKLRKCRLSKKYDSRFMINDNNTAASDCRDLRTTVMIKNIPNKYSQKLLLNMLDNHCIQCNEQIRGGDDGHNQPISSYDFVYLPIDFNNKCNVGYGFVNMTSPEAAWRLYKAFHLQAWEVFNSRKICEVTYARVQGLEALKEHFKNSKFPCEMDHYLPVVFTPPRDGRQLTEPLPIGGHKPEPPISNDEMNGEDERFGVAAAALVDQQEQAMNGSGNSSSSISSHLEVNEEE